jgi:adenine-specific DNA-methyltransferase
MEIKILKPRKAINKAFLKIKPNRTEIESFKTNLIELLDRTNDTESEEFHKNLVSDFLKDTYYKNNHFINTKGRNDLVIHNGNKAKSTVGVIVEAKKPTNKAEMLTKKKINVKAFQELVLYYLRERITHKNLEIKYLVATNINEWFIFDSNVFEKQFAQSKGLVKQFNDFENGRLTGKTTDFFYKEIAEPFINGLKNDIEFTFFDIREYEKPLRYDNPKDDNKLISLFKLLSPEHLLKLPFANDSNSLDKRFYGELLHIIGLSETKDGSKKLIERNKKGERNTGSFLENAIIQLDSLDKINRLDNPSHFGTTQEERLFNVGLELSITWINRILFLKLLEAQLKTYHKGDKSYEFLSIDKIQNYDDLNSLFFQVLAKQQSERNEDVTELFAKVPYLNSSLFEPTGIEHGTLFISNLRDDKAIPIYSSTVLKSESGRKRTGNLSTIEYLFEFLNAYDFSSEGKEEIQEDNKTLINASVLGLIFEKINGYKDGSFFTPGFITMYMCRETIRKAVIQKFNETKDWNCKDIDSLYDKIEDRQEANDIINSLKICDPAVGSGHFLVSALNEMIAIKNDLKVLQDRDGKRLKEYQFEVVNDELIVTDEDGELFEYNPTNKESQRIQEALFHEKQTIIENCLFGVDINPNSVKICRLRLWIELLKNAYYKNESELETLPNIDINIKCGNSLISRFELDSDLKKALKSSKWTIDSYRIAVDTYRNAQNKEQKREMEKLIDDIKNDFRSEISLNDPKVKKLKKLQGEIFGMTNQTQMFEMTKREKSAWNKKLKKLTEDSKKLETIIEEIKNNKIYEEAFEWRFEFPEVLDDNGDFVGFDAIIGNPPYIDSRENIINEKAYWKIKYDSAKYGKTNTYEVFVELGINLLNKNGYISYIIPVVWLSLDACKGSRQAIFKQNQIIKFAFTEDSVFEDANVDTLVFVIKKDNPLGNYEIIKFNNEFDQILNLSNHSQNKLDELYSINLESNEILEKVVSKNKNIGSLDNIVTIYNGIATGTGKEKYFSETKLDESYKPLLMGNDVHKYYYDKSTIWIHYDRKRLHRARNEEIFLNKEKIIMQRIRNLKLDERIIATIDYEKHYTFNSVNNLLLDDVMYNLKYVLGILNSKMFNYLYKSISKNTNITAQDLNKVPFRLIDFKDNSDLDFYNKIIEKVTTLLNETEAELKLDTKLLELDNIVYDLYGITEDEIKIIEEANA